ncbi:MAG: metallophosphoesterase [Gammaproteobacteria bacterium]
MMGTKATQLPQDAMYQSFPRNETGRDFVVGDLHGMFSALEQMLLGVEFDAERDRLFSVGDLIDRGPESQRCLEFLDHSWFHAVQGNHERMMLTAQNDAMNFLNWTNMNGGGWWHDIDDEMREAFMTRVAALPLAMEIATEHGSVGIVHADIPLNVGWHEFVEKLEDASFQDYALWSRNRLKLAELSGRVPPVEGIDLVVVGHTPLQRAVQIANIYYLDTAAAYWEDIKGAKLSLLQIHPGFAISELPTAPIPDDED